MEEKGIDFFAALQENFQIEGKDIRSYSPLTLAYIGDAVYEVIMRSVIIGKANRPAKELHKLTTTYVNAKAQAESIDRLREHLTKEEIEIYKRGRNAKSKSPAKNASLLDYRKATGYEALIGYLYVSGQTNRIIELIKLDTENMG